MSVPAAQKAVFCALRSYCHWPLSSARMGTTLKGVFPIVNRFGTLGGIGVLLASTISTVVMGLVASTTVVGTTGTGVGGLLNKATLRMKHDNAHTPTSASRLTRING